MLGTTSLTTGMLLCSKSTALSLARHDILGKSISGAERPNLERVLAMAENPMDSTRRKLFGGAIECLLPAAFVDVSDFRQIPDHQEVFVSKEGGASIIVELLAFEVNLLSKEEGASARHYFNDLGTANGASISVCDFCADLTNSIMPELEADPKVALAGRQTVSKFRGSSPPEAVRVYLVNARLSSVSTDLLITVNVPYHDEESAAQSMASAECFTGAAKPCDIATLDSQVTMPVESHTAQAASEAEQRSLTEGTGNDKSVREENGGQETSGVSENSASAPNAVTASECGEGTIAVAALQILLRSFAILDWSLFR